MRGKSGNNINVEVSDNLKLVYRPNVKQLSITRESEEGGQCTKMASLLRSSVYLGGKWPVYRDG